MASLSFFSASAIRSLSRLTSANSNFARLTQMVLLDIFQVLSPAHNSAPGFALQTDLLSF